MPDASQENVEQGRPTPIPVSAVDADQLPREKAWTYDEFCRIVGSLYLDSHKHTKAMEEQFQAISNEYQRQIMQLQAALVVEQESVARLKADVSLLKRELETRDGTVTAPGDGG